MINGLCVGNSYVSDTFDSSFFHIEDQKADLDGMHDRYMKVTRAFRAMIAKES